MRVVVDLQSCQSGSRHGGIGRYSLALFKAMVKSAPQWEFIAVLNDRFPQEANLIREELRNLVLPSNILNFKVPAGCAAETGNRELTRAAEILREQFIRDLDPDVVHLTSLFEALREDIVTSVGAIADGPPTAVTLYDLIPVKERRLYLSYYHARSHYFSKFRYLEKAASLLAISQFSAEEAAVELPDYKGLIFNIKAGVDDRFHVMELSPKTSRLRAKYGVTKKAVLYTASFDPRKNQTGLIRAFAALPAAVRNRYQLVFIGHSAPSTFESLTKFAISTGLQRNDVRFVGRIGDDELVQFYNICDLFVFPTKWEGLGLPVLEAMACGAPVIGSDSTSITEVIGWDEALFDPNDTASIAGKLEQALTDPEFRSELRAHGLRHVKDWTWERTAERASVALEATVAKARRNGGAKASPTVGIDQALRDGVHIDDLMEDQVRRVSECAAANETWLPQSSTSSLRKTGWITTWGTRCGIAAYSRNLLDTKAFEPIIFAPYANESFDDGGYQVIRCWDQGKYDSLIDLENAIERENPSDLVIQFNYGLFEFQALSDLILAQRWYGRRVFVTLHSTIDQMEEPTFRLAHLRTALQQATKLFVHSYRDAERLAGLGIRDNVILAPQGVNSSGAASEVEPRRLQKIATYGFFLPGKGLLELVEALAIANKRGLDLELLMVNAEYPIEDSPVAIKAVRERIVELALSDKMTMVTEYLPDAESLALLRSADIVVFPYQQTGESSSAAVRVGLASGRPVAVTPVPIFDDVRDATFVLPGCSPAELADGLGELARASEDEPQRLAGVLAAAERWREVNDVRHAAKFLADTIETRAAADVWDLALQPKLDELPLVNGALKGDCIESAGDGVVVYGPYATLSSGQYRLIAYGAFEGDEGGAWLRITGSGGALALGEAMLADLGQDVLADVLFDVQEELPMAEFIFLVKKNAKLKLSKYEIYRCSR